MASGSLNILHVTSLYFPSVGGTEVHTRQLSLELARLGHQVSIFTTDAMYIDDLFPKIGYKTRNLGETIFSDSNIAVYRFHVTNSLLLSFAIKGLSLASHRIKNMNLLRTDFIDYIEAFQKSPFVPKLYFKLINSNNIDVVNSTPFPFGYSLILKNICSRKGIPFIITPRAHTSSPIYSQSFLLKTAKESDAVIALTKHEQEFFINHGVPKDKVFVTGIGVSPETYQNGDANLFRSRYNIPENSKIVLFIGRIDEGKGVGLLLKSIKLVWNKNADVYLVLLGRSTENTAQIQYLTKKEKRVIILPDASENIKNDALSASDLLVLPSIYESFGGVFLEAWSAGKPVIGCRTPAVSSVITDMVDGLLVLPSENDLAEKLILMLEDETSARRMGEKGKEKVLKNYTWKIIAIKTLKVYEKVLKR